MNLFFSLLYTAGLADQRRREQNSNGKLSNHPPRFTAYHTQSIITNDTIHGIGVTQRNISAVALGVGFGVDVYRLDAEV